MMCDICEEKPREKNRKICRRCRAKGDYMARDKDVWDASQFRWRIKHFYGISPEQYYEMLDRQGGVCAICSGPEPLAGRKLAVDHDHSCCPGKRSCGKCIRGLLCSACNTAIGLMKDDPKILLSALSYIQT